MSRAHHTGRLRRSHTDAYRMRTQTLLDAQLAELQATIAYSKDSGKKVTLEGYDGQHRESTRHTRGRTGHGIRPLRCLGAHQSRISRRPGVAEALSRTAPLALCIASLRASGYRGTIP
jgi:hypothetical protein